MYIHIYDTAPPPPLFPCPPTRVHPPLFFFCSVVDLPCWLLPTRHGHSRGVPFRCRRRMCRTSSTCASARTSSCWEASSATPSRSTAVGYVTSRYFTLRCVSLRCNMQISVTAVLLCYCTTAVYRRPRVSKNSGMFYCCMLVCFVGR